MQVRGKWNASTRQVECKYVASGMQVRDESNLSTQRVEFEYATRLECDVTLELYRTSRRVVWVTICSKKDWFIVLR